MSDHLLTNKNFFFGSIINYYAPQGCALGEEEKDQGVQQGLAQRRRQDDVVQCDLGLVPYAGRIGWRGAALAGRTTAAIAGAGIVQCPQTRELFGDMSAREYLDLGGRHLAAVGRERQLSWLLDLVPILRERPARRRAPCRAASSRCRRSRALMMQPKLLILDEPSRGLASVILEQLPVLSGSTVRYGYLWRSERQIGGKEGDGPARRHRRRDRCFSAGSALYALYAHEAA